MREENREKRNKVAWRKRNEDEAEKAAA